MARDSIARAVVEDIVAALQTLETQNDARSRRDVIRTVFSAIEGLHWELKQDVFRHADQFAHLSIHEKAALLEETYSVDKRGAVHTQPRFLPLPIAIRMVVNIVRRYRPDYKVDFNHAGWSHLTKAIEV